MAQSTITSKNQTTVPKEVRDKLGTGPGDVLHWEVENGHARKSFAEYPGCAHPGDAAANHNRVGLAHGATYRYVSVHRFSSDFHPDRMRFAGWKSP